MSGEGEGGGVTVHRHKPALCCLPLMAAIKFIAPIAPQTPTRGQLKVNQQLVLRRMAEAEAESEAFEANSHTMETHTHTQREKHMTINYTEINTNK